ncbi:MAG: Na(+)-translocating NADH-quinone reductase subunit F [Capnocytophaga sp.]|nr:Na(+)-translocating NADH-quinone reductase subunit F [Capnocytophaga sp.]
MLTDQELHNLAMNIVGNAVEESLGWEFLMVNSQMDKDPQFVCVDAQNRKHFIIVRPVLYGDDPDEYDLLYMEVLKKRALEKGAYATYWAGVGLTNIKDKSQSLEKGKSYHVNFKGLLKIE